MAAGFGGVHPYAGLTFMYKIKWKSVLTFYWDEGGFMKNVAVTFSVLKSIYEWPVILITR